MKTYNPYKEVKICFGGKDWREAAFAETASGWRSYIADGIKLYVDDDISFTASTEFDPILESVFARLQNSTAGKVLGGIRKLSQAADAMASAMDRKDLAKKIQILPPQARYQTTLAKLPAWKSTNPIDIGSFSFNFYLGMTDKFDGRTEVYNPALALYRVNQPIKRGGELIGPSITPAAAYGLIAGATATAVRNVITTTSESSDEIETEQGTAYKIEASLSKALEGIENTLYTKIIAERGVVQITWGQFNFPPFVVENSQVKFSKETDDNGYPVKGTVTWSGCKSIEMAYYQQIPYKLESSD